MTTEKNAVHPIVLAILDGWGLRAEREGNAIAQARTPNFDKLQSNAASTTLAASGEAVGLAHGQPGNPQAGYMTLGAGCAIMQPSLRVSQSFRNEGPEPFDQNAVFRDLVSRMRRVGGTVHLIGLVSPSSYSGNQNHLATLAALFSHEGVSARIHAFMDGIQSRPQGGLLFLTEFLDDISAAEHASIATLMGRAYGLDDQSDPALVKLAMKAMVEGDGPRVDFPLSWLDQHYRKGVSDDRIPPMVEPTFHGLRREDAVVLVNLRCDIGRDLLQMLEREGARINAPLEDGLYSLTPLSTRSINVKPLFTAEGSSQTLSEILSDAGSRQLLLTEAATENNLRLHVRLGRDRIFPGESLLLGETPPAGKIEKRPYLAAEDLTAEAVRAITAKSHELVILSLANATVVGRTGNMRATVEAVEAMDKALGKLVQAVEKKGGLLLVTSTHGKAEQMLLSGDIISRATSDAAVPFILFDPKASARPLRNGGTLADIAPTILHLLGFEAPPSMSGHSLLETAESDSIAG